MSIVNDIDVILLKRPTRVKANSRTEYLYAPAMVSKHVDWPVGTVINILDVYPSKNITLIKVMRQEDLYFHTSKNPNCNRYVKSAPLCSCQVPIEELKEPLNEQIKMILLSDIGK